MATESKVKWRLAGEEVGSCNCAWGCPCQFNALPTNSNCEALVAFEIRHGFFGETRLDGVKFARVYHWPGPIHEGNGTRQTIVDAAADPQQRDAILALDSSKHGGLYWEIFTSVCPNVLAPVSVPISLDLDRERRVARAVIPGVGELRTEPIKNPVTGEEHRVRIELPDGFEYKKAEVGNSVFFRVSTGKLSYEHENTYAQLNEFDWSSS